ncbi:MAG: AI-2E family transporter [Bacteroidetes bacterium]|nr:AI-2E family transporter [Bacteroidota bacterium]
MNNTYRVFFAALGFLFAVFMIWYFSNIVVYIIISAVLSMIGHPLVKRFDKIKIWKVKLPHALSAFFTLLILISAFVGFIWFVVPLIISQANMISNINVPEVLEYFNKPIGLVKELLIQYNFLSGEKTIEGGLEQQIESMIDIATFSSLAQNLLSTTGALLMAIFSIVFITFFFLRDEHMFENMVILLSPEKHTEKVKNIIAKTKTLLTSYLIGLMIEVFSMMTLLTIGLTVLGIKGALLIGFLGGLMNIIPYLGPIIGASMGMLFGITTALSLGMYDQTRLFAIGIVSVFAVANLIDNFLLQPLIYSNSVKARPIEIFIVIIMAGSIAGVPGMILAIPGYTVLRIVAKEFLSQSRIVQKLTEKI